MVRKYRVEKWKREGGRWFKVWGERQICRGDGGEEQADMDGLLAT